LALAFSFAFLSFAFLSTASLAAVPLPELPEEVVTASVIYDREEDKYLSPGMVTVIRPEEKSGEQRSLPDLLDDVPGLRVIRLQGRNGYATASVRGSTSSQVAVYVDGVLMNLESESAVDLSVIPVEDVERVEVYKGYIPAQFGAQAMGGVINIVTKFPEKRQIDLSLGIASFGKRKGTFSYASPLGKGKFLGSLGYETYDGDFEYWNDNGTAYVDGDDYTGRRRDNGFENGDVLLKWEDAHWKARASWTGRERDLSLMAPGADRTGISQPRGALLDTDRWDFSLGRSQTYGSAAWGVEFFYTEQSKAYDSRRAPLEPTAIGGINVRKSEYDASRFGVALRANMPLGERHFFEFLAEYSDEGLDVKGDSLYEYLGGISHYDREDWNLNLQDTVALDGAGTFLATPSLRWHKLDGEDHFTWQLALTKEFSPHWMAKAAYGTYARSPNLYERYGDGAFIIPAEDDLKWETGTQFDVGVVWNETAKALGNARANVSLSGFWRETDDLLEFLMANPRYGRYFNVAKSQVKGVELELALDWEKWGLALSGTWMDGVNKTPNIAGSVRGEGKKLPNRPEWSGALRLTRKFDKGSVFAEFQYVEENYADSNEYVLFDARNLFNVGFKYDLSPTTRLTIGVNDVFNDADQWRMRPNGMNGSTRMLWYPIEGRSYYLTFDIEL
jgi:outer membrane cobalamin receptor